MLGPVKEKISLVNSIVLMKVDCWLKVRNVFKNVFMLDSYEFILSFEGKQITEYRFKMSSAQFFEVWRRSYIYAGIKQQRGE